jgi:hypothetical protein
MKAYPQAKPRACIAFAAACFFVKPALAELSCEPPGTAAQMQLKTQSDPFFERARQEWAKVTRNRYVEGNCSDISIPGYEGFPTKECSYQNAGEGDKKAPLSAKVVVLNPSAAQLASWAIHACRSNGAPDSKMPGCLKTIVDYVSNQNGTQFPVVGSVVESKCDYLGTSCNGPITSPERAPVNTLFRDGVSISYRSVAHWTPTPIDDETYTRMFDTVASDKDITDWYKYSRISGAERKDWEHWRMFQGLPIVPAGVDAPTFDLKTSGWGKVSRSIHQAACKSELNELFDALVFSRGWAK